MLATELAQSLLCLEQGLELQPLRFQHAGVREWLGSVRVQAAKGDVNGAWQMPGGVICRRSQVENAAEWSELDGAQKTIRERAGRLVEMGEKDDGASFPALVVAVDVDSAKILRRLVR
jgi:hypothetical protein